jgi:hypothetical protein
MKSNPVLTAKKLGNILILAMSALAIFFTTVLFMSLDDPKFNNAQIAPTGLVPVSFGMGICLILNASSLIIYHLLSLFGWLEDIKSMTQNVWRAVSFLPLTALFCITRKEYAQEGFDLISHTLDTKSQLLLIFNISAGPIICALHILYRNSFVVRPNSALSEIQKIA